MAKYNLKPASVDILKVPAEVVMDTSDAERDLSNFIANAETRLSRLFQKKKNNPLNISTKEMEDGIKTVAALYSSVIKDINNKTESAATKIRQELVDKAFNEFSGLKIKAFGSELEGLSNIVERFSTSLSGLSLEEFGFGDDIVRNSKTVLDNTKKIAKAQKEIVKAEIDYKKIQDAKKTVNAIRRSASNDKIKIDNMARFQTRKNSLLDDIKTLNELMQIDDEALRASCEEAIAIVDDAVAKINERMQKMQNSTPQKKEQKAKLSQAEEIKAFAEKFEAMQEKYKDIPEWAQEYTKQLQAVSDGSLTAAQATRKFNAAMKELQKQNTESPVKSQQKAVENLEETYKTAADIVSEAKNKILGNEFDNIFSNNDTVEECAASLEKVRNKIAEIKDEARDAKVAYDATFAAMQAYTGSNLNKKSAFASAIKDSWEHGEHAAAAKLFQQYKERFPDGKFNPDNIFGSTWTQNYTSNLEEANRSLSVWRAQLKNTAGDFAAWDAMMQLQSMEGQLEARYQMLLKESIAKEKEAAASANALAQARKNFATNDLATAQNNLNGAIDEYNAKLEKANSLLAEKRRLEELDDPSSEPWAKEETLVEHLLKVSDLYIEASDEAERYKVVLKEAVKVYRELGGDMKLPFEGELLGEIDAPIKAVTKAIEEQTDAIKEVTKATDEYSAAQKRLQERYDNLKSGGEKDNFGKGRIYSGREGRLTLAKSIASDISKFDLSNDEFNALVESTYKQFSKVKNLLVDKKTWTDQVKSTLNEKLFTKKLYDQYPSDVIRPLSKEVEFFAIYEQVKSGIIDIESALLRVREIVDGDDYLKSKAQGAAAVKQETKAIEENTTTVEANVQAKKEASKQDLGYHAGDLGKAESYGSRRGIGGSGHFGRGTYFVGDPKKIEKYNWRDGVPAPIEKVDFSKYNLFKPQDTEQAHDLHDALAIINNDLEDIHKKTFKNTLVDRLSSIFVGHTKEAIANALEYTFETISKYEKEYAPVDHFKLDSSSTVFMKKLGYEGIDTRHTGLDNKDYGSVIYDLKGDDLTRRQEILKLAQQNIDAVQQETSVIEENTVAVKENVEAKKKLFMHAGYLGDAENTLPSFPLGHVMPTVGGEGVSGLTGLYVISNDPENIKSSNGFAFNEWHGSKISTIDPSFYNLFDATSNERADQLGTFISELHAAIYGYAMDAFTGDMIDPSNIKTVKELYSMLESLVENINMDFATFQKFVKESQAIVAGHNFKYQRFPSIDEGIAKSGVSYLLQGVSEDIFNSDSFGTRLLKTLGFEGYDVSGTKYDGTYTGGSVVFNIKPESVIERDALWSNVMSRYGFNVDGKDLLREKQRAQLDVERAKVYSKQAEASEESASQAEREAAAKAKLTRIQRQAYNYRRETDNVDALAERESTLSSRLGDIESIRTEFPALVKACDTAEKAVSNTLNMLQKNLNAVETSAESAAVAQEKLAETNTEVAATAKNAANSVEINEQALRAFKGVIDSDMVQLQGIRSDGTPEEQAEDDKTERDAINKAFQDHAALSEALKDKYGDTEFDQNIVGMLSNFIENSNTERKLGGKSALRNITSFANGESDITDLANGYYKFIKWINTNGVSMTEDAMASLDSLFKYLLGQGVEIIDRTGATIGEVLYSALPQVNNVVSGIPEESRSDDDIITSTIKPVIMQGSKILQRGVFEVDQSAANIVEAQGKLAQAHTEVAISADKAKQQIQEQTEALENQTTQLQVTNKSLKPRNLTVSESQAIFGDGSLDELLSSLNVSEDIKQAIIGQFADIMRLDKTSLISDNTDEQITAERMLSNKLDNLANTVINAATVVAGTDDNMKRFSDYMSGKQIRYNNQYSEEFGSDWKNVRKRNSRLLTTKSSGIPVDTLYQEILELFPELFDSTLINPADKLKSILAMMDRARDAKKNNFKILEGLSDTEATGVSDSIIDLYADGHNKLLEMISAQQRLVDGEKELSAAIENTNQARIAGAQEEVSAEELIERDLNNAISMLRSAQDNATTLFSLKGVFSGEDLVDEARNFVGNIAEQANLKVGSFGVKNDLIQVQLYNDELKVTVDQTYRLQQATEETEAALELIGQSFKQNVKALNTNNFDVDGIRARANASIEKLRASLHGLSYNLSDLEHAAKNINSQDDFTKFNNQLKAAQDNIQAIRSSTVSKNSMNPFANMQRDMQNANIELETMQLKLQKIGDVHGAKEAQQTINDMRKAVEKFNDAADASSQQNAYNTYSNLRSKFKAELEYLNVAKTMPPSGGGPGGGGPGGPNVPDPNEIKRYYQTLNTTIQQISQLETKIHSLELKDGGSGAWAPLISSLEMQRDELLSKVKSTVNEINDAFDRTFVVGDKVELPFSTMLNSIKDTDASGVIESFFSDFRTQEVLTEQSIDKFITNLQNAQNKTEEFATALIEKLNAVPKAAQKLSELGRSGAIDTDSGWYQGGLDKLASFAQYRSTLAQDPTMWSGNEASEIQRLASEVDNYVSSLDKAVSKEAQYFASKKQYANISTIENYDKVASDIENLSSTASRAKQDLESFVKTFANGKAIVTGFTTSADGISRINFSVLDEATNQFRTFSSEMGMFTDKVYTFETSMKNLSAGTDAANKSLATLSQVAAKLSGIEGAEAQVQEIWQMMQALQNKLAEVGASKDVGSQTMLKNMAADADKTAKSVNKMADAWKQVQDAIDGVKVKDLDKIDMSGDIQAQMYEKIKASAEDASISNVKFSDSMEDVSYTLTYADGKVVEMTAHLYTLNGAVIAQQKSVGQLKTWWQELGSGFGGIGKELVRYGANMLQVMDIVRYLRTGFNEVKEIDSALTELRKVTNETDTTYSNFLQTMSKSGSVVGSTVKDLVTSAADWGRLGYSIEEAGKLAENTMILMNVSEFDNVTDATDSMISAIQAFKDENANVGDFSMDIIDVFNQIGNSYAISTSDLADSLTRSSASLVAANNTLEQSVALTTAANTTIQNPEVVGTTLKTLAMRIRGVKTELEEAGEDTEGMITNTSKLQAKVKALTNVDGKGGIDILANSGEFKSTYDILLEISKVWEKMGDMDQAALLEIIAGKRAGSAVAGILQNGDILESAYRDALGADGSAMQELNTYLDSVQGKLDQLSNSTQTMWMNFMNSEALKVFIDIARTIVETTDKIGLLKVALAALFAKTSWTGKSFGQFFKLDIDETTGKIEKFSFNLLRASKNAQGVGIATKAASVGVKALNAALSMGVALLASFAIEGLIKLFDAAIVTSEEAAQAAEEAVTTYNNAQESLRKQKSTIDELAESYEKLSKGVDTDTNENINLTTESYQQYLDVCNDIADVCPNLVQGFDEQGNAILSCKGNVEELTQAYNEMIIAANNAVLVESKNIFDTFKDSSKDFKISNFSGNEMTYNTIKTLEDILTSPDIDEAVDKYVLGRDKNLQIVKALEDAGLQKNTGSPLTLGDNETDTAFIKRSIKENRQIVQAIVSDFNKEMATEVTKVQPLAEAYISNAFLEGDYSKMSFKAQDIINSIVSKFDFEFYDQFESADDLYKYLDSMLNNFNSLSADKLNSISNALDLKLQLEDDKISLDKYRDQILSFIDTIKKSGLDKRAQEQILQMLSINIDDSESIGKDIDTMIAHAQSLVDGKLKDKVLTLNYSDLQIINSDQFKVEEGILLTWEQLQAKIKETKIAMTEDFTTDNFSEYAESISAIQTSISTYQEALESLESGTFTFTDFMELIAQFPELADGVDLSSKEFRGLSDNLRRAIRNSPDDLVDDLKDLRAELVAAGKSTDAIDQLIASIENMPSDAVDNLINKYSTLADEMNAAKVAQTELQKAMSENPNEGYETRGEAIEAMKTLMEEGKIGSESELWSIAKAFGFTPDSAKTINENADALYKFITTREKWYATDDDGNYTYEGIESFIEYVEDKQGVLDKFGATWSYEDDVFEFDLDNEKWEEFAKAIGLTSEEFSDLMVQIGQFFGINWGDADDALAYINKMTEGIKDPKEKLDKYGKMMQQYFGAGSTIDLTKRPNVEGQKMRDAGWSDFDDGYATVYSSSFSNEDGTKTVVVTPILPDGKVLSPSELESYANKLLAGEELDPGINIKLAEFAGEDSIEQADQYAAVLHLVQEAYYNLLQKVKDPFEIKPTLEESGLDGLKEIKGIQDAIKKDSDGLTVLDEDAFRTILTDAGYAVEDIDALIKKIQEYQQIERKQNTDPLGIKDTSASIESVSAALNELDILYSRLPDGEVLSLEINAKDLITTLKEKGWDKEKINAYIQTLQSDDNPVDIKFDLTQSDIDAALDEIMPESGIVTAMVDYSLGTQEKPEDQTALVNYIRGTQVDPETAEALVNYLLGDQADPVLKETLVNYLLGEQVDPSNANALVNYLLGEQADPITKETLVNYLLGTQADPEIASTFVDYLLGEQASPDAKTALVNYILGTQVTPETATALVDYLLGDQADPVTKKALVNYLLGTQVKPDSADALVNYLLGEQMDPEMAEALVNYLLGKQENPETEEALVNYLLGKQEKPKDQYANIIYTPQLSSGGDTSDGSDVDFIYTGRGGFYANGTAHAQGTVYKSGSWGAEKTEEALVGELGPELRVRGNQWTLVGENGAEFTDVKKGDIIFNHKQTEDLLKNGYVTGRGKAYASGTAFASGGGEFTKYSFSDTDLSDASGKLSKAAKDIVKSGKELSKDFKDVFDWIEVRIEEITEDLDLKNAKLENTVGSTKQNAIIDDMIALNQKLYDNLTAGASKYYAYAEELLQEVPAAYRDAAKDGSIAIESFTGKVGQRTFEAIQNYREWVQKGADATQQAEETLTEISNLAKQAIDNIAQEYENQSSIPNIKIEQLEAYNSLIETTVGSESDKVYQAMIKENNKNIKILEQQRDKMQAELNAKVESGQIKKYSQNWYDAVNDIAAVDTEIIELTTDTEDYRDAMNELHWDHFDNLLSRLEAVSDESENLIDILGSKDLVNEDTAEWTDDGITSLALYAQQMEIAEVQAQKYKEEINYLNKNWKKLGYTEQEYVEKLEELKSGQYDAIKSYHDTKKALKDLTAERVDAIKKGIEKEIEAYEELINKKKEELDAEKDLYDFQRGVADQQKEIADIERKLAAISADNSASARAQRAQLQAELAKAQQELQDTYYDRSVQDQQDALDKELENFRDEKEKEIEGWDEYLENTELVVSDALATVQSNTEVVYQTLQAMGEEYSLSIANAIISPWEDGAVAIQDYSEKFKLSMSSTVEELQKLAIEYKKVMDEIDSAGGNAVNTVDTNIDTYQKATYTPTVTPPVEKIAVGDIVDAGDAKIYSDSSCKDGEKQYYDKNPKYKVVQIKPSAVAVTHVSVPTSSQSMAPNTTGWFRKKDLKKANKSSTYAKGTTGVSKDEFALIDELGEELVIRPSHGRMTFLEKGSGVIPADLTANLMEWGELDPSVMLERNRPEIKLHPEVHNTEVNITMDVAEVVHIDKVDQENMPDLTKAVEKQLDKYMKNLNNQIRRYVR